MSTWESTQRPASVTPANDPSPNSTSATGTHSSASPAGPTTTGATKVNPANVAAFTRAASASARTTRGRPSTPSSARNEGDGVGAGAGAGAGAEAGDGAGRSPPPGRRGTPTRTPTAAGRHSSAIAQNVARQPSTVPTSAPAGTPSTVASVVPERRMASARPRRSGATRVVAVLRATARKPAFASAATTRVTSSSGRSAASAPTTCVAANTSTNPSRLRRAGHRRASAAVSGAPTTIPIANAGVASPTAATGRSRSAARSGTRPARTNSDVPMANTATARRYSGRGIETPRRDEGDGRDGTSGDLARHHAPHRHRRAAAASHRATPARRHSGSGPGSAAQSCRDVR